MCISFYIEHHTFCQILKSDFDSENIKNYWSGVVVLKFLDLIHVNGAEVPYITFTIQHQDKQILVWAIYIWFYELYIYDFIL